VSKISVQESGFSSLLTFILNTSLNRVGSFNSFV